MSTKHRQMADTKRATWQDAGPRVDPLDAQWRARNFEQDTDNAARREQWRLRLRFMRDPGIQREERHQRRPAPEVMTQHMRAALAYAGSWLIPIEYSPWEGVPGRRYIRTGVACLPRPEWGYGRGEPQRLSLPTEAFGRWRHAPDKADPLGSTAEEPWAYICRIAEIGYKRDRDQEDAPADDTD